MSKSLKFYAALLGASLFLITTLQAVTLGTSPIGFASMNGGTTGGKGGTEHTVTTGDEINAVLKKGASNHIFYVNGTITPSNTKSDSRVLVKEVSNISIIGVETKGDLNGIGLKIYKSKNIIIQNLAIHHVKKNTGDGDAIIVEGKSGIETGNIWIDHCDLYNDLDNGKEYYDGLLDIKKDCEYVTVSWTYVHDSYKTSLIGYTDSDDLDRKITYHNMFFYNCNSRVPSIRGGTAHVFNTYFLNIPGSGINCRTGAKVRIEGNVFENVKDPIVSLYSDKKGAWDIGSGNKFIGCSGSQPTSSKTSFTPPYSYNLTSLDKVKNEVLNNVGYQGTKTGIKADINKPSIEGTQRPVNTTLKIISSILHIKVDRNELVKGSIITVSGKEIATFSKAVTPGNHSISLENYIHDANPTSLYIITISMGNLVSTFRYVNK